MRKLDNIIEYNFGIVVIILHLNPKFISIDISNKLYEFENQHNVKIIINSEISYENFKYKQVEYYLSNFNQLLLSNIDFDYIVFDNFDSLYVQHNSADYMSKFDIGMNFGSVGGYWKDKILSHQSLADWVAQKMDKQISSINCICQNL
ncbi:hypothetical protein AAX06_00385 [Moraxella bovoculi]|uniref:Uncharacterized protein n=1 Tax=Moraxella bovoculi TaxID=386891 RepID=A0AAC8PU42_9GAMM|nr:hypothetical protein AAX06_00385 [Moraxella bovoculi]AKG10729.1 hypothetical protein AAX07_00390 [Moraxella bovoculi]